MPGCSTGSRRPTPSPRTPCEVCTVRLADVGRAVCELVASQPLTADDRPGRDRAPLSTRARRRPGPAGCVGLRPRERRFGSAVARGSATDARSRRAVRALRPVRLIRVPRAPWTHARCWCWPSVSTKTCSRAISFRVRATDRPGGQGDAAPCARVTILRVCQVRANLAHSDICYVYQLLTK